MTMCSQPTRGSIDKKRVWQWGTPSHRFWRIFSWNILKASFSRRLPHLAWFGLGMWMTFFPSGLKTVTSTAFSLDWTACIPASSLKLNGRSMAGFLFWMFYPQGIFGASLFSAPESNELECLHSLLLNSWQAHQESSDIRHVSKSVQDLQLR